jgi:hypothetical protein
MASSQSAATPLPVVESILQSACNNQINNFARFGGFGKNECTDADRKLIIGTATAEAMAETRYVPADDLAPATAWARAKAELDYHGDQFGNKDSGFRGRALASATLVYSVGFIETEMPPATGFDIPLMMEVTIAGTVSFGSRGSGGVVAGSDVNQPGIYDLGRVDATAFPDKDTGLISLDEKNCSNTVCRLEMSVLSACLPAVKHWTMMTDPACHFALCLLIPFPYSIRRLSTKKWVGTPSTLQSFTRSF